MQILHPCTGSVPQYLDQLADPDRYRPTCCPQCQASQPLIAHGFYSRTLIDTAFDEGEQMGLEKGEQIGLEKGEQIGRTKALQEMLEKLIAGGMPEPEARKLLGFN